MALLLVGTAAAMVVTQHLRHDGPVVSNIFLKHRPHGSYRACFTLTRTDTVQAEMVDASGQPVRVLLPAQRLQGGTEKADAHCYTWDGTDDGGAPVPAGTYYLRFQLEQADRTATSGEHVVISSPGGG
ncbi:MAG TPA: FlgD immunoglobulin-like domain containing protein [Solirubrobacterales bacterium]|nr:FlgD immunoglobulin-like domain containing protein [Solirubrobacterales bacterium]